MGYEKKCVNLKSKEIETWNKQMIKKGYDPSSNCSSYIRDAVFETGKFSKINPVEYEKMKNNDTNLKIRLKESEIKLNDAVIIHNAVIDKNAELKAKNELLEKELERDISSQVNKILLGTSEQIEQIKNQQSNFIKEREKLNDILIEYGKKTEKEYEKVKRKFNWINKNNWVVALVVTIIMLLMVYGMYLGLEKWKKPSIESERLMSEKWAKIMVNHIYNENHNEFKNRILNDLRKNYKFVKKKKR